MLLVVPLRLPLRGLTSLPPPQVGLTVLLQDALCQRVGPTGDGMVFARVFRIILMLICRGLSRVMFRPSSCPPTRSPAAECVVSVVRPVVGYTLVAGQPNSVLPTLPPFELTMFLTVLAKTPV